MLLNLVVWAVFGCLAGWLASLLLSTKGRQGAFMNILVGIAGAMIGGFVLSTLGDSGITGINIPSLITAIFGSVVLLAIVRPFVRS